MNLWNLYISPHFNSLDKSHQIHITKLLNDFRDIIDPEHFVPLFFYTENWIEYLERDTIIQQGRELH
jgi:hypothetical protein